ncbi:MAG: hypothetical protein KF734_16485 [Saprospiraceae bacterium]|nr:hypothetical protein [Saprospiraceae bacterium]
MNTADLTSGFGVFLILTAFSLNTFGILNREDRSYFILNLAGGVLASIGAWLIQSIPFLVLETTWTVVAIAGLAKSFRITKNSNHAKI